MPTCPSSGSGEVLGGVEALGLLDEPHAREAEGLDLVGDLVVHLAGEVDERRRRPEALPQHGLVDAEDGRQRPRRPAGS